MQKQKSVSRSTPSTRRLPFRPARALKTARRVLTVVVAVIIAVAALTSLDNALTPAVQLTHTATGPAALSVVRSLEVDTDSGALYAGSNAGVFKSTDGGVTWLPASQGLPGIDIQYLMYDSKTRTLYAVLFGVGLFRSTDGAASWQGIGQGMRSNQLLSVAVDPRTGLLYAGLQGYGMYTSNDGGANWETIGFGLSNTTIRQFLVGDQPGEVFAATDNGVYHTTVVTGTWDLLTGEPKQVNAWSMVKDTKTGAIYIGTEQGVLKIDQQNHAFTVKPTGLSSGIVQSIVQDAGAGVLYAGSLHGVLRSVDGGATWNAVNSGLRSTLVHALILAPRSNELIAGTDSGIFRSSDGGTAWLPATQNPDARSVQAVLVDQRNNDVYAGLLGGGVFRSSDGGDSWTPINTGLNNAVVQAFGIDHGLDTLYAGTRGGIYRTKLDAISWAPVNLKLNNQSILTIAVDERHGNVYAVNDNGDVFRSTSNGAAWEIVQPLQRLFARTVAVSEYASVIYVGAYKGGVMASHDFGFSWRPLGNIPDRNIEAIAVDERDGSVYAGTLTGNVFKSSGGQSAWTKLGDSLPSNIVALRVDEKTGDLFAALKEGLYRIGAADQAWQRVVSGMTHTDMLSLAYNPNNGLLYAGVTAGGAFRSADSGARWQAASNSLTDVEMRNIVADDTSGVLTVSATDRGIYTTKDGGKTWQAANDGLNELTVRGLADDKGSGALTFLTANGRYQAADAASGWRAQPAGIGNVFDLLLPINAYGFVGRLPGGEMLWAARGGGELLARSAADRGLVDATMRLLPDGRSQLYAVWGADLMQTEPGNSYGRVPLAWMFLRAWSYQGFQWLNLVAPWWWLAAVALIVLLLLLTLLGRLRLSRIFGVPLRVALLSPGKSIPYARPAALNTAWPKWEHSVQSQLYGYGDVSADDLPGIPAPFRLYAMQRFAEQYGAQQSVKLDGTRLVAAARSQMRRWVDAWEAIKAGMLREGAAWTKRKHVDQLAAAFSSALGIGMQTGADVDAVRVYALQPGDNTALPAALALLFVADNEALRDTVTNLAAALDSLKLNGATGLVVSLGRPGREVNVTNQIRLAVSESDQANRMVALGNDDVLSIMSASDPLQALAARLKTARQPITPTSRPSAQSV
ncbi:MAG: hypothetical protein M1434_08410 [Chloroflexi bacterium]|nr:hypothetical protein [Chloroflexota bacterium]MCL5274751.1 hypothetical protein [Chloroflexota bacterium]